MSLTNDELYHVLIEQLRDLTSRHVVGQSKQRTAKLRETLHLLDAYEGGENITLAKLAYVGGTPSTLVGDTLHRIRHHLYGEGVVFASFYVGEERWCITRIAIDPTSTTTTYTSEWRLRNATRA